MAFINAVDASFSIAFEHEFSIAGHAPVIVSANEYTNAHSVITCCRKNSDILDCFHVAVSPARRVFG